MIRPYDHVKHAGHITDNLGTYLGLLAGAAGFAPLVLNKDTASLAPIPIILGGGIGALIDHQRMQENLKNKDMSSYRMSAKDLKEQGFSREHIDEILKHPLHVQASKKQSSVKSALEVSDKENILFRPISGTIGKLNSIVMGNILGVPTHTASLEDKGIQRHLDSMKDHPALKDVAVHLGSMRLFDRLSRIWGNSRNDFLDKLYGTGTLPIAALQSAFGRADHFDPLSNTVTLYHGAPSILAHELGHAVDYNTAKDTDTWRRLYFAKSPVNQEYLASNLAMNRLAADLIADRKRSKDPKQVQELSDQAAQLTKALGTYRRVFGDQEAMRRMVQRDSSAKSDVEFLVTNPKVLKKVQALLKRHKLR